MIISILQTRPSWDVREHLPTRPAFPLGHVHYHKLFGAPMLENSVHGAPGGTKDPRR